MINNVKKTISEIIKDVLEGANDDTNTDEILESVVSRVPPGIKIMTADVNGDDLRGQITEEVSTILSEKAADQVRNRGDKEQDKERNGEDEEEKKEEEQKIKEEEKDEVSVSISESTISQPPGKRYRTEEEAEEDSDDDG